MDGWDGFLPSAVVKNCSPPFPEQRTGLGAARALRKLLYGGAVLLNTIVLTQAWKRLRTDGGLGLQNQWHNAAHSALGLVRRGLRNLGL